MDSYVTSTISENQRTDWYETSTGTKKMRKTNALYLKTQRLIAEKHRDTEFI